MGLMGLGGRLGAGRWVSRAFGWLWQGCEGQGEEHRASPAAALVSKERASEGACVLLFLGD